MQWYWVFICTMEVWQHLLFWTLSWAYPAMAMEIDSAYIGRILFQVLFKALFLCALESALITRWLFPDAPPLIITAKRKTRVDEKTN